MKKIMLTQHKIAKVDDQDFGVLSQHRWYARKDMNTYYAQRKEKQPDGKWKIIHMHREILNVPKGLYTDHIDGNGLNNQRYNLRIVTHQQNMMNMRKRKDNTSGTTGIYWHKREKKWEARFNLMGKTYFAGEHRLKEDAIGALDKLKEDLGV